MFQFKLNNFRSLVETDFEFSRVNILIGENSSGKSSLIKFFQLLQRSYRGYNLNFNFTTELGSYSDFIYKQEIDSLVSFEFGFKNEYIDFFKEQNDDDEEYHEIIDFANELVSKQETTILRFHFGQHVNTKNHLITEMSNPSIGTITIKRNIDIAEDGWKKEDLLKKEFCAINFIDKDGKDYQMINVSYDRQGFFTIVNGTSLFEQFELNYPENTEVIFRIAFLLITQNYLRSILNKLRYINPLDSVPLRVYGEMESQGYYPIKDMRDVVNILTDESINKSERRELLEKLNDVLRNYGIIHELKIISSGYETKLVQVKLSENGVWSNIKDVGYGTTLQIPIFFEAILGEKQGGEIIMIEQPEIHIHPNLQSRFIELLLSIGNKNTYIIETHSEDIVRKLQVMIKKREFELTSEEVRIYYFRKAANNICTPNLHKINDFGKLIPAFPPGFYDTSANLVKELF